MLTPEYFIHATPFKDKMKLYQNSNRRFLIVFTLFLLSIISTNSSECEEKLPLSERREQADLIFSGIVTKVDPENDTAQVEVIQTFKDRKLVLGQTENNPPITIRGVSDPSFCVSSLTTNVVKIIMVSVTEKNEFYLNSSLVDISIESLRVLKVSSSQSNIDTCQNVICPQDKTCQVNRDGNPECVCKLCNESEPYEPVCASNNIVYANKCQLDRAKCVLGMELKVLKSGFCEDPCTFVKCGFGAFCVPSEDMKTATCQCSEACPLLHDPVCANDGTEFSNVCMYESHICHNQKSLEIKYNSKCDPCEKMECRAGTRCKIDSKTRQGVCSCGQMCIHEVKTVCGSDGYDYNNECELQRHACMLNRKIEIVARHSCSELSADPCSVTSCSSFAECTRSVLNPSTAECACAFVCEPIFKPVCGKDSSGTFVQFDNECEFRLTACQLQKKMELFFYGPCSKVPENYESKCRGTICDVGKECSLDNENNPTCICAESCSDFEYEPICASNGRTYTNVCELKRSACTNNDPELKKISDGPCPNACNGVECKLYGECRTKVETGEAECLCPDQCSLADLGTERVCGSDGESYQNVCEMKKVSCQMKKEISVSYYGLCFNKDLCENKNCHKYATCQRGTCVCEGCGKVKKSPVCGSDGNTFESECEMRKLACEQNSNVSVRHYGACITEETQSNEVDIASQQLEWQCSEKCIHGSCYLVDGIWQCLCPKCGEDEPIVNTLCGEDNITYRSKCHLKQQMCMKQTQVGILHYGSCNIVSQCSVNSEMIRLSSGPGFLTCNGDEQCPVSSYCYEGYCCFSRQKTSISCSTTIYGCCADETTFALGPRRQGCPENCMCNELGAYGNRCDMFSQCVCRKGVTGKKCDRCSHGYWNFTRMKDAAFLGCDECRCNVNGSERLDCDQTNGECLCKPGVFGKRCDLCPSGLTLSPIGCVTEEVLKQQQFFDACDNVKCLHGSTCVQRGHFATCECPTSCMNDPYMSQLICASDGKTYTNECEMVVQGCSRSVTLEIDYYGECKPEFKPYGDSDTVIMEKPLSDSGVIFDQCKYVNCRYGGTCISRNGEAICLCNLGHGGELCEQQLNIKIPKFSGYSYLEFPKLEVHSSMTSLSINIKPDVEDGIILYIGPDDFKSSSTVDNFLLLYIQKFILHVRCNLEGFDQLLKLDSYDVSPDFWHHIEVSLVSNDLFVQVGPAGISEKEQSKQFSKSTHSGVLRKLTFKNTLKLGGVRHQYQSAVFKSFGVSQGFVGCMTSLYLNGNVEIDLSYPDSAQLLDGSGISSCEFNPCSQEPCSNDGTCIVDDSFSYWCVCKLGYSDPNCQTSADPCAENPCQNGGICEPLNTLEYECHCPLGFDGDTCESFSDVKIGEIFMPSFNMNSYLKRNEPIDTTDDSLNIEIWFYTRKLQGLILFNEQKSTGGDFIALEIVGHKLVFQFDLGKGVSKIMVDEKLKNRHWYKVVIKRSGLKFELILNNKKKYSTKIAQTSNVLSLKRPFYVGGFDSFDLLSKERVSSTHGFRGIIQKLEVNGVLLIGNQTLEQISANFDESVKIKQWSKHECYKKNKCNANDVCLPNLDDVICLCQDESCQTEVDYQGFPADESMTSVSFDGSKSYVIYNSVHKRITSQKRSSYEFSILTTDNNGILFWAKEASMIDFFSLGILNGYLHLQVELGAGTSQTFSVKPVNDGVWHTVVIDRGSDTVDLKLDNEPAIKSFLYKGASKMDTDGLLWIGGLPEASRFFVDSVTEYRNFTGCLKSVYIDGNPVNFYSDILVKEPIEECSN